MSGEDRYLQLADIAAEQWGMVTTAQARQAQVSAQQVARLTKRGVLNRMQHGVYRLAGVPEDPMAELKAAWLALEPQTTASERLRRPDPRGVISHRSAATLHRLGELDTDTHEFIVAKPRRSRHRDVRLHVRAKTDWDIVAGLPTTTVAVTIADLAATRTDGAQFAGVLRNALDYRLLSPDELAQLLRPYAHLYGAPLGDGKALLALLVQRMNRVEPTPPVDSVGLGQLSRVGDERGAEPVADATHARGSALGGPGHAAARRAAAEAARRAATRRTATAAADAARLQARMAALRHHEPLADGREVSLDE